MDAGVAVAVVSGEAEAEIACGLLRAEGIECGYRLTEQVDSPLEGIGDGPREILVHEADAELARGLLADVDSPA